MAKSTAAATPHSPTRCRRAGCRVRFINTQVRSNSRPPPTTLRTNQPPGVVQIQPMTPPWPRFPDSALIPVLSLLSPRLGDHCFHPVQLLRGNPFGAQQTEDELVGGAVEHPIQKPGGALISAEPRRV